MVLIVAAVAAGLAIGRLLPPAPRHLGRAYVRAWWLLLAGVAVDLVASRLDGGGATGLLFAGTALLTAFAVVNVHLTGMGVLLVGLALNLLAVAVNRGMPVRPDALVEASVVERAELPLIEVRGGRHLERGGDPLPWLGDIVPVPVAKSVVSFGDLIVAVGAADVVAHLSRRRATEHEPDAVSA